MPTTRPRWAAPFAIQQLCCKKLKDDKLPQIYVNLNFDFEELKSKPQTKPSRATLTINKTVLNYLVRVRFKNSKTNENKS